MKTVLPLSSFHSMIMIEIGVWNKLKNKFVSMLITLDTGASVTTISADLLHQLGYDTTLGVIKRITTASNVEYVKSISFDRMKIGEFEINDIEVYSLTFPPESFSSGVLGLNVLKMFDINLLFSKGSIEFAKY